jgi:hypothetical protein
VFPTRQALQQAAELALLASFGTRPPVVYKVRAAQRAKIHVDSKCHFLYSGRWAPKEFNLTNDRDFADLSHGQMCGACSGRVAGLWNRVFETRDAVLQVLEWDALLENLEAEGGIGPHP